MRQTRRAVTRLIRRRDRGAAGSEYGFLAGFVAVAIIGAVALVGGQLAAMFTGATYALRGETPPGTPEPARMVLVYDSSAPTCASSTIRLPVGGDIDATIDWGDGSPVDQLTNWSRVHTYAADGRYTITIDGTFERFSSNSAWGANCLVSVDEWGDTGTTHASHAFAFAAGLTHVDSPPATVVDMSNMFDGATAFNGDLSSWDVSSVTDMAGMFRGATSFEGLGLSAWQVSNVTDMSNMFDGATAFNGDLSSWDVSSVTDMAGMFRETPFSGDLSGWNTESVTVTGGMFERAASFNSDISGWDMSRVTYMNHMFSRATAFDQDLSGWDVSSVTSHNMFDYLASSWQAHHKPVFN